MRALFLLALVSLTARADDYPGRFARFCDRTAQARTTRGLQCDDLAFFEAFPASGAGTFGACSTTPPTGAKGEVLTFTRGSNGTCQKTATGGLATTGIANGDLVVLSSNQPRVSFDANGTLGLLVESSRTNNVVRSEEIGNAAWTDEIFGAGLAPVITANFATAPDGTTTADRIQFSATSGTDESMRIQGGACGTPCTASFYVRGNGTSGSLDICPGVAVCGTCNYVAASWTRCVVVGSAGAVLIGNGSRYNGGVARAANDVLVWGAQTETASFATSYIPTVASAVTRSAETAYLAVPSWPDSPMTLMSGAVSMTRPAGGLASYNMGLCAGPTATADYACAYLNASGNATAQVTRTAVPARTDTAAVGTLPGLVRLALSQSTSTTVEAFLAGVGDGSVTAGVAPDWTVTRAYVGTWSGSTFQPDAILSRLCLDPSPTRCR
jgi:hypothetical protein